VAPTATTATRCVVPNVKGRTYLGARTRLRRAGCSVGTVYRPTRTAPKGMVLRVTWQLQKPGSVRKLNSRIMLRLSFVKRPRG
jgi:beta-lactam-binding protein with PASTA domain